MQSVNTGRSQIRMELVGPILVSLGPDVSEISPIRAAWSDMAAGEQGCFSGTGHRMKRGIVIFH